MKQLFKELLEMETSIEVRKKILDLQGEVMQAIQDAEEEGRDDYSRKVSDLQDEVTELNELVDIKDEELNRSITASNLQEEMTIKALKELFDNASLEDIEELVKTYNQHIKA